MQRELPNSGPIILAKQAQATPSQSVINIELQ